MSEQQSIRDYVERGGKLWVSGSEILWDLDQQGTLEDKAFADEVLGASLASDDANTYLAEGEGILSGIVMDFDFTAGAVYDAEWPDVLSSESTTIARYDTGGIAAIAHDHGVTFGFPFETIIGIDERVRLQKDCCVIYYPTMTHLKLPTTQWTQAQRTI